jgi:hypothetical protein
VARLVVLLVLVAGAIAILPANDSQASAAMGPEGVTIQNVADLAPASTTASGTPIDGITCRTTDDQTVKDHTHTLVEIYVDGKQVRIPAGVGIPAPNLMEHLSDGLFIDNGLNGCLYWLHVHSNDGVIHVESPQKQTFTLGQFFDIWQQPLNQDQVGPATGQVVALENGRRLSGDPRAIPLTPGAVIQLDVGNPVVAYHPVHFKVNGLCGSSSKGCATKGG